VYRSIRTEPAVTHLGTERRDALVTTGEVAGSNLGLGSAILSSKFPWFSSNSPGTFREQ
jgi:hypothetical protein